MDEEITVDCADWANRLMWNMKTRRKIIVEDADWENRLLWNKQTVRTNYCGLWRLDAQITVENGDWKKDYSG